VDAFDDVLRVIEALNSAGVEYVVIGGVGLNVHGIIRATEDLDLFVRPDAGNVARLRSALKAVWSDPSIEEITADDLAATIRRCVTGLRRERCSSTSSPGSETRPGGRISNGRTGKWTGSRSAWRLPVASTG
jgi:hypothetical protein